LLISDLSISHGLLLCSNKELHRSISFPDPRGADVQSSAAERAEHLGTGQEHAQLTPLGGTEQKVTGSHPEVSVSTDDLTSSGKKLLIKCRLPPGPPLTVFSRTHLVMKLYHCILGWLSLNVNLVPNICC